MFDLDDSGADTVKELEAEGVRSLGAIHSVHAGVDIFTIHTIIDDHQSLSLLILKTCFEPDVVVPCVQINSKLQI